MLASFEQMQFGDFERLVCEINTGDDGTARGHTFRQNPSAASHIKYLFIKEFYMTIDIIEA